MLKQRFKELDFSVAGTWLSFVIVLVALCPHERLIPHGVYAFLVLSWLVVAFIDDRQRFFRIFVGKKGSNTILYLWVFYLFVASLAGHAQFPMRILMVSFCLQMFVSVL